MPPAHGVRVGAPTHTRAIPDGELLTPPRVAKLISTPRGAKIEGETYLPVDVEGCYPRLQGHLGRRVLFHAFTRTLMFIYIYVCMYIYI